MGVDLSVRMKAYEQAGNSPLLQTLPVLCRIDGKCFHSWTRGLQGPYDGRLSDLMACTTRFLVLETGARVGYTQSDEISLLWQADEFGGETFMGGDRSKIISLTASMATAYFNSGVLERMPCRTQPAMFDSRAWNVPDRGEVANYFVWREADAVRNSIQMLGQAYFSHKQMRGMTCAQIQESLWQEHGVNWNDVPDHLKRGAYFQRRRAERTFTYGEIAALPPLHAARKDPSLVVSRSQVRRLDMPRMTSVMNRIGVLVLGEDPIIANEGA